VRANYIVSSCTGSRRFSGRLIAAAANQMASPEGLLTTPEPKPAAAPIVRAERLGREPTHHAGLLCAALVALGSVTLPLALAYAAGARDGQYGPGNGTATLVLAAVAALPLLISCWSCCGWMPNAAVSVNLVGMLARFTQTRAAAAAGVAQPFLMEDLDDPTHALRVTAAARKSDGQLAAGQEGMLKSLMSKLGVTREEMMIPSTSAGGKQIYTRIYRPHGVPAGKTGVRLFKQESALPILIFVHGGGFVVGGPHGGEFDTLHDPLCARLAAKVNAIVVMPDYRLAPQHKFPAAPDDVLDVLR